MLFHLVVDLARLLQPAAAGVQAIKFPMSAAVHPRPAQQGLIAGLCPMDAAVQLLVDLPHVLAFQAFLLMGYMIPAAAAELPMSAAVRQQ
jgi:hypothetical protein